LVRQHALSLELLAALRADSAALASARSLRAALRERSGRARGEVSSAITALDQTVAALEGAGGGGFRGGGAGGDTFARLSGQLAGLLDQLQDVDLAPTPVLGRTIAERLRALETLQGRWREVTTADLPALNRRLRAAGLPVVEVE
jgi:hypothetical protein